jgi:hypothetical protein
MAPRHFVTRHLVTLLAVMSLPLMAMAAWRDGDAARQVPDHSIQAHSQTGRDARLVAEGVAALKASASGAQSDGASVTAPWPSAALTDSALKSNATT